MISLYMIFTALATTALGKGSIECNFSEPTGALQCFGAVGQLLIFHLPKAANTEVRLTKDDKYLILKIRNQTVTRHEEYANQFERFTNGTIKLGKAMKRHSGDYLLEEFGFNGTLLKKMKVHVEIQAPVSKPAVSQLCLSQEQMNISCSSTGDEVEFILTLDGHLLIQTRAHSTSPSSWTANMQSVAGNKTEQDELRVSNVTISLQGQLTGNLTCNVSNNVSRDETVIHLQSCKDAELRDFVSSFVIVTVAVAVAAGVVTLLLLSLCLYKIHLHNKQGNSQDEAVYTNVREMKKTRKTIPNSQLNGK